MMGFERHFKSLDCLGRIPDDFYGCLHPLTLPPLLKFADELLKKVERFKLMFEIIRGRKRDRFLPLTSQIRNCLENISVRQDGNRLPLFVDREDASDLLREHG